MQRIIHIGIIWFTLLVLVISGFFVFPNEKTFAQGQTVSNSVGGGNSYVWRPGQPIVPCGGGVGSLNPGPCNFNALLQLARNVITFLFWLAVPASLLLFGWAGALYLLAGYNEGYISTAKSIFWYTIWGLVFMAGGWLLVYTITSTLLHTNVINSPGFLLKNIR